MVGEDDGHTQPAGRAQRPQTMDMDEIEGLRRQQLREEPVQQDLIEGLALPQPRPVNCNRQAGFPGTFAAEMLGVNHGNMLDRASQSACQFLDMARDAANIRRIFAGDEQDPETHAHWPEKTAREQ